MGPLDAHPHFSPSRFSEVVATWMDTVGARWGRRAILESNPARLFGIARRS